MRVFGRMRRSWRGWVPLVPPVVYVIGLLLHVRLNSVLGSLVGVALYAFYGILLIPLAWSIIKAKPGIWRSRFIRQVFAGTAIIVVALIGLAVAFIISGRSSGIAQTILGVVAFTGFGVIFLAMCIGLLDASKNVIERYHVDHPDA